MNSLSQRAVVKIDNNFKTQESLSKFFRTKHSLPQGTFYMTTLFSSTGAFISLICDAKEQTS